MTRIGLDLEHDYSTVKKKKARVIFGRGFAGAKEAETTVEEEAYSHFRRRRDREETATKWSA